MGDETPQHCQVLAGRVIKAFRAGRDRPSPEWQGAALRGILVDSYTANAHGGTGRRLRLETGGKLPKAGFSADLGRRLKPG